MLIGPLQFDSPWWLLLFPIGAALVVLAARKSLAGLGPVSNATAIALRLLALLLAAAALAEPSYRLTSKGLTLIVVSDVSRSVPPAVHGVFEQFLGTAVQSAPPEVGLALVTTAEEPRVQLLPSRSISAQDRFTADFVGTTFETGPTEGTNLEQAVRLALAVKPDDTAARIMLVSDGNETDGSLLAAAESLKSAGVPLDIVAIPYDIDREVIFDSLVVPANARMGQTVNVRFAITSMVATRARLTLTANKEPVDLTPGEDGYTAIVDLVAGSNVFTRPIPLTGARYQRFEAIVEPLDAGADTRPQNNTSSAVTFVSSEGRILVYAEDPLAAEPLMEALRQARLDATRVDPAQGHTSLGDLQDYDAVVLFDVPAQAFSLRQQRELVSHVHDAGAGLVMIGGPNSFGAGGWIGTPLADALPVKLDPPQKRQILRGALVIVIDRSGSMSMPVGLTGMTQQRVAIEAAILGIQALSQFDLFSVVVFDSLSEVIFPIQRVGEAGNIEGKLRSVPAGGGTDMFTGMQKGAQEIAKVDRGARHMIVLTDGQTAGNPDACVGLTLQLARQGVTVSTVGIGAAMNDPLLQRMAQVGGGEYYQVDGANHRELPQIFVKESQRVRRSLIWEGDPVQPEIVNHAAEAMRGIRSPLPPITGYVVTAEREGLSLVTAKGPEDDPIVAQWQHGLGRTIAFTSDATARWSSSWVNWGQFRAFWEQHLRWVMRPSGSANVQIATFNRGESTRVVITALDSAGDPLNFARFQGRVSRPDEEGRPLELRQTGPGRYEAEFESNQAGSYLVSVRYDAPKAGAEASDEGPTIESGTAQAAVSRPFADEYRAIKDNAALLRQVAELTGGRVLDPDPARANVFDRAALKMPVALTPIWLPLTLVAMGLFLADVAVRRVRVDIPAMARAVRRVFSRSARADARKLEGLKAAREVARSRFGAAEASAQTNGEAAPQQPMPAQPQPASADVSRAKFEATSDELRAAPRSALDEASPVDDKSQARRAAPAPATGATPEEGGISRLKRAKMRAQDSYKDDEPPG